MNQSFRLAFNLDSIQPRQVYSETRPPCLKAESTLYANSWQHSKPQNKTIQIWFIYLHCNNAKSEWLLIITFLGGKSCNLPSFQCEFQPPYCWNIWWESVPLMPSISSTNMDRVTCMRFNFSICLRLYYSHIQEGLSSVDIYLSVCFITIVTRFVWSGTCLICLVL